MLGLERDGEVRTRAVLIGQGVQYRKLDLDGLERLEGAGVDYAATEYEGNICAGSPVVVVGGGNSAGQAAVYLAGRGSHVTIAVRRSLAATMSNYLIDRIDASPDITVRTSTEVIELHGDDRLEAVTLKTTTDDGDLTEQIPVAGMFSFIGAIPKTSWLAGTIALDQAGFVLTDDHLPDDPANPASSPQATSDPDR